MVIGRTLTMDARANVMTIFDDVFDGIDALLDEGADALTDRPDVLGNLERHALLLISTAGTQLDTGDRFYAVRAWTDTVATNSASRRTFPFLKQPPPLRIITTHARRSG